jgi:hypothetical protein
VFAAGDPAPPTTTGKASAAFLWGLAPVILGGIIVVLQNATTLFAGGPAWVYTTAAVLLVILGPVASYLGAYHTPNRLLVGVQTVTTTPEVPLP